MLGVFVVPLDLEIPDGFERAVATSNHISPVPGMPFTWVSHYQ